MLLSLGGHSYEIVKTHFQHILTVAALNVVRIDAFDECENGLFVGHRCS